jgi:hypothetical protein
MQTIIKKFRFRGKANVLNAPKILESEFVALGFETTLNKETTNANTLVFINDNEAFLNFLKNDLKHIKYDSVLWFGYPKSSKIKTDINRDSIRMTGEGFGIQTVATVSIDETWSALRFRPIEMVGK